MENVFKTNRFFDSSFLQLQTLATRWSTLKMTDDIFLVFLSALAGQITVSHQNIDFQLFKCV